MGVFWMNCALIMLLIEFHCVAFFVYNQGTIGFKLYRLYGLRVYHFARFVIGKI